MAAFRFLACLVALVLPAAAVAQSDRDTDLVALAGVLGESQALRELCEGKQDAYWRSRMMRLMSVEEAEGPLAASLTSAFNSAYGHARTEHAACSPQSRRAEADAAARGQDLAAALAAPAVTAEPPPEPVTPEIAAPSDAR